MTEPVYELPVMQMTFEEWLHVGCDAGDDLKVFKGERGAVLLQNSRTKVAFFAVFPEAE